MFLLLVLLKNKSVAIVLLAIQLVSLLGTFFIGRFIEITTIEDLSRLMIMSLLLSLIILPWKYYYGIKEIKSINSVRLNIITKFLIVINFFVFIVFLITTIVVMTTIKDVNEFKYAEGVSTDFYYNMLPFPTVFFNISILFYYFSYFMLPLHFYYLYKKKYWLSILCFVFSLNIVLYGLTFFSRAVVLQFVFLYFSMLYLLYGALTNAVKKTIKISLIVIMTISVGYFIDISQRRFDEDREAVKTYSKTIPNDALTQDPVTFSYLDYASQGFFNGYEVLEIYEGEGFDGKLTYQSISSFFNSPMDNHEAIKYRQKLWPKHYSYSFNGFTAYAVYDYGIVGSILLCIVYFFSVRKIRPKNGAIDLKNLFLIGLLIQIPLMSIFYNQLGGIFIAFILLVPLWLYMKKEKI